MKQLAFETDLLREAAYHQAKLRPPPPLVSPYAKDGPNKENEAVKQEESQ